MEQATPVSATIIPPAFLQRMERLLGEDYTAFADSYKLTAESGLRLNTLKVSATSEAVFPSLAVEPLPWVSSGYRIKEELLSPGKHPFHAAGLYYLQEPSAMAAVELLEPQPGEWILDLAAAPGGKSTHIAALMQNRGWLVANEIHPKRVWELAENLERWGVKNATVLNETPSRLANHFGAIFDRVLVDAPCSGEGMFRKSKAARSAWSLELVRSCADRQLQILQEAARLARPGGVLAYTTCTFAPEENEGVIARFLASKNVQSGKDFEILQVKVYPQFATAHPDWVEEALYYNESLNRCIRLWPHHGAGEGHFIAILRSTQSEKSRTLKAWKTKIPNATISMYRSFCESAFYPTPGDNDYLTAASAVAGVTAVPSALSSNLHQSGSYLYALPVGMPDLNNLKTIHPGWWLGVVKTNRFEPSHALAMALKAEESRQALCFPVNSQEIRTYLHGESLFTDGPDGWMLVCVALSPCSVAGSAAFPLGWGRRTRGVVKNLYPRGLRWH